MSERKEGRSYGLWIGLAVVAVLFVGFVIFNKSNPTSAQYLTPIDSFSDAHGMAVDVADSSKLYIATHHGLLMLKNDKNLYQVGSGRDDYMGFSLHPTDPKTFFTSGHPSAGGNLGFQKSTDAGRTWQKIADGVNGPVDFHSMAVSQVNPELIYGSYGGQLQRSTDGGNTWQLVDADVPSIYVLATDAQDKNTVYAATENGLYVSNDQGDNWQAAQGLNSGAVKTLTAHPTKGGELLSFSDTYGFARSTDGGVTWQKVQANFPQPPVYLAYDGNDPATIYALLLNLDIYKTEDGGKSWGKIR